MITSPKIKIMVDFETIAYATGCEFEGSASLVDVIPLPNSSDDDGWKHFALGGISMTVSNDSFYSSTDNISLLKQIGGSFAIGIDLGNGTELYSTGLLLESSVTAQIKSLAKMSMKFKIDGVLEP